MWGMTQYPSDSILTSQGVTDLEVAAKELHILRRALHPRAAADGLSERLIAYAQVIEATLRTAVRDG
jgi:hypothetical protein